MERKSLKAVERTTDSLTLEWDRVRNTDVYVLYYKQKGAKFKEWTQLEIDADETNGKAKINVKLADLSEGTKYVFVVRADSDEREGFATKGKTFATKTSQEITGRTSITKLTSSKPFKLSAEAKTNIVCESSDTDVIAVDEKTGKLVPQGEGTATITATAVETDEYVAASKEFDIRVLASEPVDASGSSARIIYHLDSSNCEVVKVVTGSGSIDVPQSIGYTGDKYIIAYGMYDDQRIITFDKDGDGKSVSVPGVKLGHPNGFCYADSTGLCYCVKGNGGRCVTYNPETGAYDVFTLPNGASGIAYDRRDNLFYTSAGYQIISYSGDGKFTVQSKMGNTSHTVKTRAQDIGGHAGIVMKVLSSYNNTHDTNYIDLYDVKGGRYLGTLSCNLSEVESAFCDEDGYLMLLANNLPVQDYIWKTNINIEDIAEGLGE